MTLFHAGLMEVVQRDPRYAYEAYEFLFHALHHTQKGDAPPVADRRHHVSGRELVEGARDLALREFGFMARTVFRQWGIQRTDDFGEMVFNLIEAGLMSKTDEDRKEDFCGVFDLDRALVQDFRFTLGEAGEP